MVIVPIVVNKSILHANPQPRHHHHHQKKVISANMTALYLQCFTKASYSPIHTWVLPCPQFIYLFIFHKSGNLMAAAHICRHGEVEPAKVQREIIRMW